MVPRLASWHPGPAVDDADLVATRPGATPAADGFVPHDRYILVERLGHGGMGTVWAAHDKVLDRTVALKVLHDEYLGAEDQARLVAEARAMARLSHRNVVDVYDVAEKDGRTYLTMELVRGISLDKWLATPRDWRTVVAMFRAAAQGLAAAHEAGIVHRDIKPANILVGDDGEVRVADFGVAHASVARPDPQAQPTAVTAGVIGTLAYMSPEQLHGQPADARSDQFAFFSSLYEALHGRRPFLGDDVTHQLALIEKGCPPPVNDVPGWLHAAIARGLSVDPAQRYPSIAAAGLALVGPRRHARWIVSGIAVGAAAIVTVALLLRSSAPAEPVCPPASEVLAATWSPPLAAKAEQAFASIGAPFAREAWQRIAADLGEAARQHADVAIGACRANEPHAIACAAEQGALLRALVERLATVDRVAATRTVDMFVVIDPRDCSASASPELAAARADLAVGATAVGLEHAARAARDADHGTALAGAIVHARLLIALGRVDEGLAEIDRTTRGGLSVVDLEVEARLAAARAGLDLGRLLDARGEIGRVLVLSPSEGTRVDPRTAAQVHLVAGEIEHASGNDARAIVELEAAAAHARSADTELWTIPIHDALARAYLRAGRPDEALEVAKRAIELARRLGETHPAYGRASALAGRVNLALARIDKARTKTLAAQRIALDVFGEQHLDVAETFDLLGGIAVAEGDDPAAETQLQKALAIRQALAPTAEATFETKKALAKVQERLGRR